MPFAIEAQSLSKKFAMRIGFLDFFSKGDTVVALDDVSFDVKKRELFVLIGPNGAGKTTLIKILSTMLLPTCGTALINGYDILSEDDLVRKSIGLAVSDERSFYWRLTGRKNLEFFAALYGIKGYKQRVNEVFKQVELEKQADNRFNFYSSGAKQRMAIARALLNDPEIIFMDEPTRSLDPATAFRMRKFIKEELVKQRQKTVILTTHNMLEAEELGDRIAIMNKGKLNKIGSINDLKGLQGDEIVIEAQNISRKILSIIRDINGVRDAALNGSKLVISVSDIAMTLPVVIKTIVEANGVILSCNSNPHILEKIYLEIGV